MYIQPGEGAGGALPSAQIMSRYLYTSIYIYILDASAEAGLRPAYASGRGHRCGCKIPGNKSSNILLHIYIYIYDIYIYIGSVSKPRPLKYFVMCVLGGLVHRFARRDTPIGGNTWGGVPYPQGAFSENALPARCTGPIFLIFFACSSCPRDSEMTYACCCRSC